jgi:predicted enzyme related to lactoylglutathione lyase
MRSSHNPRHSEEAKNMADDSHIHHAIDYIEFAVTDMVRSKDFYEAAFDWRFTDYGPDYAGIRKEGGEAGGLRLAAEVTAGGPLVILYSNDLDATIAKVRDAGGRIKEGPYDFPGGRRFHFEDPSGNELAVWADR